MMLKTNKGMIDIDAIVGIESLGLTPPTSGYGEFGGIDSFINSYRVAFANGNTMDIDYDGDLVGEVLEKRKAELK